MLLADTNSLVHHALGGVSLHRKLWLSSLDEEVLGTLQVALLDEILGMMHHDLLDALPIIGLCNSHGRDPVPLVDVHVNGLLGLAGLDELLLCQLELLVILKSQGLLEVNVRQFVLGGVGGQLECMLEVAVLHGIVNCNFDEAMLGQKSCSSLCSMLLEGNVSLSQDHLLEAGLASVDLGHTFGIFPFLQFAVHAHGIDPHLGLHVVVLCLLQVSLHLVLFSNVFVSIVQQLLAVFGDKAQHLLVLLTLLVHIDGEVKLIDHEVHLLCLTQLSSVLQGLRQLYVQLCSLRRRHVCLRNFVRLFVLSVFDIHLDGTLRSARLDESTLSLLELSRRSIVGGELLIKWQSKALVSTNGSLVQQLFSLVPLPG
mmetsp:Transcript_23530/g.42435  ORF Transcript_23530/g.42435 Transcript_23530/m.42435 type:complete len:369 (-) Transcript_23530:2781-3887(-)